MHNKLVHTKSEIFTIWVKLLNNSTAVEDDHWTRLLPQQYESGYGWILQIFATKSTKNVEQKEAHIKRNNQIWNWREWEKKECQIERERKCVRERERVNASNVASDFWLNAV